MAAPPIVYEDMEEDTTISGELFSGKSFWLAQRLPSRNTFVQAIQSNGGTIVMLEKKADYCIADHFRKDCLEGSISYTFIEQSIKNQALEDPQNHLAGRPIGSARPVGSTDRPKQTRTPYTAEEDRILWKWVQKHVNNGGSLAGNVIYKQLEAKVSPDSANREV